jgi:hypothetical protein
MQRVIGLAPRRGGQFGPSGVRGIGHGVVQPVIIAIS